MLKSDSSVLKQSNFELVLNSFRYRITKKNEIYPYDP